MRYPYWTEDNLGSHYRNHRTAEAAIATARRIKGEAWRDIGRSGFRLYPSGTPACVLYAGRDGYVDGALRDACGCDRCSP